MATLAGMAVMMAEQDRKFQAMISQVTQRMAQMGNANASETSIQWGPINVDGKKQVRRPHALPAHLPQAQPALPPSRG